ncbi:MAG: endonuclease III [Spirochaetaceae bacterium]|nr:MAG: endonuclease III [Spirochaetaceae bacterium]
MQLPSVSQIARFARDPFLILISTMISLRTKDDVTLAASERLFAIARTPATMRSLGDEQIADLIYPAGFYHTKSRHIVEVCTILCERYNGTVPEDVDALVDLPGVGRKTANLVLGLGFGVPAICVDTHVHRIANRQGWVATRTPEQTELALQRLLPRAYWIEINELLVGFGQTTCTPTSPFCSRCPLQSTCRRIGVPRSR